MNHVDIQHAASQAWIGFWQTCMADAGAQSLLQYDETSVRGALNGAMVPAIVASPPAVAVLAPSDLAQRLEGDGRIADITIRDVLIGLEDYFSLFRKMKRMHPEAYAYFRRVGAPLALEKSAVWREAITQSKTPIVNATDLPAFIGVFFASSPENYRDEIINEKPAFLDFHLYEKRRRNIAVSVPPSWTIYDHSRFSLERDVFTKAERKKHGLAKAPWSFHYFIGINPAGVVHALPMQMGRNQMLKDGTNIHHNRFVIPPGLYDLIKDKQTHTVHDYSATMFAIVRNFCATALSGAQLSVRRGNEVCRFGIPLSSVKGFFRDRDREGRRRRSLLHYVGEYQYDRQGRTITVGEHLRGARRFSWRDYDITISAPGIHAPSPEAFAVEPMMDDDILPMPKDDVIPLRKVADAMRRKIENGERVPFRRGVPTSTYRTHTLEEARRA